MIGEKFGLLIVKEFAGKNHDGRKLWYCVCECNPTILINKQFLEKNLKNGNNKSCGCLKNKPKHGKYKSKEYSSWQHMKERCKNPKFRNYSNYGGRGITYPEEWESFINFYTDMGDMPPGTNSLDRIDVNGNYCKDNCRWATREEQDNNTTNSRFLTYGNKKQTIAQWSRELGINQQTLVKRLNNGWTDEEALTIPVDKKFSTRSKTNE